MTTWVLTITEIGPQEGSSDPTYYFNHWEPNSPSIDSASLAECQKKAVVGDMLVVLYEGVYDNEAEFMMSGSSIMCPFDDGNNFHDFSINIFTASSPLKNICFARRICRPTSVDGWTFKVYWDGIELRPITPEILATHRRSGAGSQMNRLFSGCDDPKMIVTNENGTFISCSDAPLAQDETA